MIKPAAKSVMGILPASVRFVFARKLLRLKLAMLQLDGQPPLFEGKFIVLGLK